MRDGRAPNGRRSIAAHGNGELGYDDFHLYLMAEPRHRRLTALDAIGPDVLDTGADAYRARWSTDSRHVAVLYRVDRHVLVMSLYRIGNRHAQLISGPPLLEAAVNRTADSLEDARPFSVTTEFAWRGANRFALKEHRSFRSTTADAAQVFGRFGRATKVTHEANAVVSYMVQFSAEAQFELVPGERYRVVELKPGSFELPESIR